MGELDDVFLYTVDDLAQVIESGVEARQSAVVSAERIVSARVETFVGWLESRQSVPLIRALRDNADRSRRHEVELATKRIARGEAPEVVIEQLSQRLTNKFLHAPTQTLGQADAGRDELHATVRRLFGLHGE